MNPILAEVAQALDNLEVRVRKSVSDERTFIELYGWNNVPLGKDDLANLAKLISDKIKRSNIEVIEEPLASQIAKIPNQIGIFLNNTMQYFANAHAKQAVGSYLSLIQYIETILAPLFTWEVQDSKTLPASLNRKLRSINAELSNVLSDKDELLSQIETIQKANEAAENLPIDLESLKSAKTKIDKLSTDAAEIFGKIDTYEKKIQKASEDIANRKIETDKLVAQCEEAYKITTTKGLAASFDQRASTLTNSMWIWVIGLLASLGFGIYIGSLRFNALHEAINDNKAAGLIWIQIFLSVLSLGAPIWFAWIATKQIGQRFKLAEDYAFKASVAKAYEGYRKEAARIDKELEKRLFSSALARLEEAPIRLVEREHYGSPWHEAINSPQFQKALQTIPDLKEKIFKGRKSTNESE